MRLTLDMMVCGIGNCETPKEFFQHIKCELEEQREPDTSREVTIENVVKKTSLAIDFFIKDRIVDKAVSETTKSRPAIENLINEIEDYPLN